MCDDSIEALVLKSVTMWGGRGGVKNCVTSFMDDRLELIIKYINRLCSNSSLNFNLSINFASQLASIDCLVN